MSYSRPGIDTQHNTIPGGLAGDSHGSVQTTTFEHLPLEIVEMIGKKIDLAELPKFRSICPLTRSFIPPASRLPIEIPSPHDPGGILHSSTAVSLRWSTVYALEKLEGEGAASNPERWLLKLEETDRSGPEGTKIRILDLFSRGQIAYLPRNLPKELNPLEFRIVKICREYRLDNDRGLVEGIHKVLMLDGVDSDLKKCSVYCIDKNGCIGLWRYGDKNWTYLDNPPDCGGYDDIAVYEGKVSVVDKNQSVWQIVSYNWDQCFPSPSSGGNHGHNSRKYLVESSGDLYLVDKYIGSNSRVDDFKVYRLDRRTKEWEERRSLGNSAFFLGNRCAFAVPVCELGGHDLNCIYYTREAVSSSSSMDDVKVFNLADGTSKFLTFRDFPWLVW